MHTDGDRRKVRERERERKKESKREKWDNDM